MKRLVLLPLALVPIVALMAYDIELFERVRRSGRSRSLGLDTIQICYATAAAGLLGASVACAGCRRSRVERVAARGGSSPRRRRATISARPCSNP